MVGPAYRRTKPSSPKTDAMVARLRALPGVEAAAAAGQIPLGGNGDTWGFHVEGRPIGPEDPSVERYSVTPDYFSVMRIPLRRGRLLTDARSRRQRARHAHRRTDRAHRSGPAPIRSAST